MPKTQLPPPKRSAEDDDDEPPSSDQPTLSRAYHSHVRAMAHDLVRRIESGEFETAEQLSETVDEVLEGFEDDLIDQLSALGVDPNDPSTFEPSETEED
jgi:hypothetical protein